MANKRTEGYGYDKYRNEKKPLHLTEGGVKGKRQGEELMDGRGEKVLALIPDRCWWKAACTSLDLLMKWKQQHAFPSLALISSLSRGQAVNTLRRRLDGGKCAADWKKKGEEQKEKQKGRVFVLALLLGMCVRADNLNLIPHPSARHIYVAALILDALIE